MLDPETWLPQARELAPGQRRTVGHICGPGNKLIIEHKPDGFSAWCYRCSDKGWHPHPQPSLAERIARLRAVEQQEVAAEASPAPPLPAEFDPTQWPLPARVWLYQAGFNNDTIRGTLGAYWNEKLKRVVLPVREGDRIGYWQARGFDPDRPKYLNPPTDKPLAVYGSGPVVAVEDILSAARVGEVVRGVALLGTKLPDRTLLHLASLAREAGGEVRVWTDDDPAGRKARAWLVKVLPTLGLGVRHIRTPRDPKTYSKSEIEEIIRLA